MSKNPIPFNETCAAFLKRHGIEQKGHASPAPPPNTPEPIRKNDIPADPDNTAPADVPNDNPEPHPTAGPV